MTNWLRFVVSFTGIICSTSVLADAVLPNSADDPNGCAHYITLADNNPPQATTDPSTINTIQNCLASCDQLYKSYSDNGDYDQALSGISYCRTNLTVLYNQSLFLQANSNLNQSSSNQDQSGGKKINDGTQEQPSLLQRWLHSDQAVPANNNTTEDAATPAPATNNAKPDDDSSKSPQKQINWF